jgi:uncharacterized protein (DUF2267 family)
MPKKFSDTDKRKWLELYDSGKSETWIAKEHAKCDPRTVRRGLEEARRKQDGRVARTELLKEALRKHQDSLLEELEKILSALTIPTEDYVVLPWHRGGDFILAEAETLAEKWQAGNVSEPVAATRNEGVAVRRLLKEHLKNDRLWKVLAQWKKGYDAHLAARLVLQRKTVAVIQDKTGCNLVDRNDVPRPFIYSYTTGDLFFRATLRQAFATQKGMDLESDIAANTASGDVRYGSLVLAEAPGNEERIKSNLLDAFRELKGSSEAVSVVDTNKALEEAAMRVRQVVEQIKLLGLIPGQCEICRRLGM